ncbi:MAG: hypothetical protein SFW62_09460 [Alphaproteobacteria bacterium]|nr:hypothetical protein [Alphaproteobacteria bacterium]
MRKLLTFSLILLLAACIDVDDFGAYWAKASLDPALRGDWLTVKNEKGDDAPQKWRFIEKQGAYKAQPYSMDGQKENGEEYPVKTFTVGPYKFFMRGQTDKLGGYLLRYQITDGKLVVYMLNDSAMEKFMNKNYPNRRNIYMGESWGKPELKIKKFDGDVYKILAAIPDDETYWHGEVKLARIKQETK